MAAAYRAVRSVLEPGGIFLDYDLTAFSGGTEAHLRWLREAGFIKSSRAGIWTFHRLRDDMPESARAALALIP